MHVYLKRAIQCVIIQVKIISYIFLVLEAVNKSLFHSIILKKNVYRKHIEERPGFEQTRMKLNFFQEKGEKKKKRLSETTDNLPLK